MTFPRTAATTTAALLVGALAGPAQAHHQPCSWGAHVNLDPRENPQPVRISTPRPFNRCKGPDVIVEVLRSPGPAEPTYTSEASKGQSKPAAKRARKRKKAHRRHRSRKHASARARR
jgi:hypothetical protein